MNNKEILQLIIVITISFRFVYLVVFRHDAPFPYGSLFGLVVALWAIDKYVN